jgi:hypothetical protein
MEVKFVGENRYPEFLEGMIEFKIAGLQSGRKAGLLQQPLDFSHALLRFQRCEDGLEGSSAIYQPGT